MKNAIRFCFTFIFLLYGVFSLGQDFVPEWDSINATVTPPTIDGTIDAVWADADSVPVENLYSGTIVDPDDFSAYWRGMYNDTALFLLIHVKDDTLMNQEADAGSNDNVEIFLNVKNKIDVLNNDGPRYDTDKQQYRVIYGKTDSTGTNADWTNVLFASAADGDGYVIEIAFPFSTIMIDTTPGHSTWIGFDLSVVDKDSTTSANLTWSNPGGVASSWNDMDQAGIIIFSEGLPLVADTTILSDLIADAEAMLADPYKSQETKDSLQEVIDDAQAVLDAGTANQAEIIGAMLQLGAGMKWYNQQIEGEFSPIEFLGNAKNYSEADPWLWGVFADSTGLVPDETVYGIIEDKPAGGNRTSILNERTYGAHGNFFVKADMKLQKRPSAVAGQPWWEDGRLFFAWQDENNYAWAQFFNTHGPAKDNPIGQTDALGLSGFNFIVDGQGYGYIHSDDPGDPVEEIPPEVCIPFEGDTSFYDWNEVMVTLKDSVLSMMVNGEVYHAIGLDTVTLIQYYTGNTLDTIDTIPAAVLDMIFTPGQIGIGSSNDRVYFDNVNAGYIPIVGKFSDVPHFGDAANYDEAEAWLWDVFSDDGEMVYGIVQEKEAGGNRTTVARDVKYGGHNYYVKADMKLQKRKTAGVDQPFWEDGRLIFAYKDANNYARAMFFNTHGPAKENPIGQGDALGLSGFNFVVDGKTYGYIHSDDPGDPVEEIPPEVCIPYVDDSSFDDWNEVMVTLEDSVLSMLVNGEVYHSIGLDTVTVIEYYTGNVLDSIDAVPPEVLDLLFTSGLVGVGSANDKVYFDNVEAGWITVEGVFSDIDFLGDAANYTEVNPWLWGVIEEDGDTRYGITAPKESGGNRTSILNTKVYDHNWFIEADVKLFKRATGAPDQPLFEDAVLFFSYLDANNNAQAYYFNHPGIGVEGNPQGAGDAFGISGIRFVYEGQAYRLDKKDDPGDPIEEIPPESCIPFVDDSSFDEWNLIRLEREGTILTMLVNGEIYWQLDVDTLTVAQIYGGDGYASWQFNKWAPVPQGAKDMLLGAGQIGIGSSNDKVYFDNVNAGYIEVEGIFSNIEYFGDAANYSELNPWLWDVTEEDGDTRYGIVAEKQAGGNRISLIDNVTVDGDYFIEADMKLFKRTDGMADQTKSEDGGFIIAWEDEKNYVHVYFSVQHAAGVDPPLGADATGMSGFWFFVDGHGYKVTKRDDPGDPLEEIPPETCLPYEDDSSFDLWNKIRVEREGTVIRMLVNSEEYFAVDFDTVTIAADYPTWSCVGIVPIPQKGLDMFLGPATFGLASGNDKVLWDNVNASIWPVGIDEIKHGEQPVSGILIYPNPAADQFIVANIEQVRKIEIYSLTGQKVLEILTRGESSITVGTEYFDSGLYFVRTTMDTGEVAVDKLIIR